MSAYFYHGIALGPRYYFEAMPWLLLLGARGVQVLAERRLLVGDCRRAGCVLTLNTVLFYTPASVERRTDYSGISGRAATRASTSCERRCWGRGSWACPLRRWS